MYCYWRTIPVRIEPADVTVRIMKTHQTMNGRYLIECGIDRTVSIGDREAFGTHADERS